MSRILPGASHQPGHDGTGHDAVETDSPLAAVEHSLRELRFGCGRGIAYTALVNSCLHKLRSARILLALLVLPGLLIRATVPPGFMPVASRGTALTMAMCPGHASQPDVQQAGPAPVDDGQPQQKHHQAPCVFAATAGGTVPMFIAAVDFLPLLQQEIASPRIVAPAARQISRAHAPRGPPASA